MKRRGFLKVLAAVFAAPVIPLEKLKCSPIIASVPIRPRRVIPIIYRRQFDSDVAQVLARCNPWEDILKPQRFTMKAGRTIREV